MNSLNKLIVLAVAAGAVLLTSCGGGSDAPAEVLPDYDRADSLSVDYLRELGTIRVSIEEAAKLNQLLADNGYSFNSGAMNSASKSASGTEKQALLLGAFGSDLNYAALYGQQQEATNYVQGIVKLGDQLGIGTAFNEEILTKLSSTDSTVNKSMALTKAYIRAEDQLYSEDRAQVATMMAAGGWCESLYIATSAVKDKPGDENINLGVWNQVYVYGNVIKMLEAFPNSADCQEVLKELEAVRGPVQEAINSQGKFTPEQITALHEAVSGLRGKLLN